MSALEQSVRALNLRKAVGLSQVLITMAIVSFPPMSNLTKMLLLLVFWLICFWPLKPRESVLFVFAALFFTVMDVLTLRQGVFRFSHPDYFGLPFYEFILWGFYVLNTVRTLGTSGSPRNPLLATGVLAVLFAAAFSAIHDPGVLWWVTAALLAIGLALFHKKEDFFYVGYMILMGGIVEGAGVYFGLWSYPGSPLGGIPLWSLTLWGGVGFFTRQLVLPLGGFVETP